MANILILGGGFAGVVAAESLVKRLGPKHQITLVSRFPEFIFYPALVRLAFGRCELTDVFFDLRQAMSDRGINFVQAEIAYPDPIRRQVVIPRGEEEIRISYDYLVFALGRRLAAESVEGFTKYAHHLMTVGAAMEFGESIDRFRKGHAVIGYCVDARLAVPVYETAFALDRLLRERGDRDRVKITVVSPESMGSMLGGVDIAPALRAALDEHEIEFLPDYPINLVTEKEVRTGTNRRLSYDLLMLIPPFEGPREAVCAGIADPNGYVRVNRHLRATGADRIYAAGDCVNFTGPKMAHLAVLQAEVAAANLAAEIEGREPEARYDHELMLVIDEGSKNSIYLRKDMWESDEASLRKGYFWSWAKRVREKYWQQLHL